VSPVDAVNDARNLLGDIIIQIAGTPPASAEEIVFAQCDFGRDPRDPPLHPDVRRRLVRLLRDSGAPEVLP